MAAKAGSKTTSKSSSKKNSESEEVTTNEKTSPTTTPALDMDQVTPANKSGSNSILSFGLAAYQVSEGEEYMNAKQLKHFKVILNKWKQDLMEEVDRTVHHMKDENASLPDPADRASQEEEFNFELRARDRERKLIKKIEQSLESIEHGEYGYCDTCGIEIGLRRLEARPTANLCIDCKTLDEIKEKQTKG